MLGIEFSLFGEGHEPEWCLRDRERKEQGPHHPAEGGVRVTEKSHGSSVHLSLQPSTELQAGQSYLTQMEHQGLMMKQNRL